MRSPASGWVRILVPSVTDLIFILLLIGLAVGTLSPRLLSDAGTGWHIRNGQQILQTRSITRTDSFSSTMNGQQWYAWEWLYDAGIAAVHDSLGLNGVVFFTAVLIAAAFASVLRLTLRRGGSLPPTLVFLVFSIGASSIHFFARPHILSWLFTVVWFELLDSSEAAASPEKDRRLFWLPVLMLIWVNLHGGFLFGFALLGLYLVSGMIRYFSFRDHRERIGNWLKRLGGVTVLSLLATLANPYGYKLHIHIYQYLSNRFLMDHIDEFLSPNFHGLAQQCFAALLLITMLALAVAREKPRLSHVLVIIFAASSGLYASRNLPVSSLLLTLIVAPLLSEAVAGAGANPGLPPPTRRFFAGCESFTSRMGSLELSLHRHVWPVVALLLGFWVCAHGGRIGSRHLMDAHFDAKRFPVEAAEVIIRNDIRGPIFSPDNWGGYLIYRLYPHNQVFVDDRHDLYGAEFLKDYLRVIHVAPDWEKVLNEKRVNWVLVPAESSLANILRETPHWTVVQEGATAALFRRAGT
jgi:hypothetical protein